MKNKSFYIFWLSQTVSELGSAMTAYALALWTFGRTGRAFDVSLLTLCTWLPFVLLSPLAGGLTDRLSKKVMMAVPDILAAFGTCCSLLFFRANALEFWHICILNALLGAANAFQSPAFSVAIGLLVPQEALPRVAGLRSFSSSAVDLLAPMLAAGALGIWGIGTVFLFDLLSFCFAISCLMLLVRIPEVLPPRLTRTGLGLRDGFAFLRRNPGLRTLIFSMALINLLAWLTYQNILSPMLLARSGSTTTVGIVSSALGLAGILGGLFVAADKRRRDPVLLIYGAAALSFLLGDLLFGMGQSLPLWLTAAFVSSFPIPWIQAGQSILFYGTVPRELQGRVFAARNALQQSSVPLSLLLGGLLADRVFEPMMTSGAPLAQILSHIVGKGPGSGMAVMFLCSGILGFSLSLLCARSKSILALARQVRERE